MTYAKRLSKWYEINLTAENTFSALRILNSWHSYAISREQQLKECLDRFPVDDEMPETD